MAKKDLIVRNEYIFKGDWSARSGYQAFYHFNSLQPRPSAVIASNDHMAIGFLKAAYENHVDVPSLMSLVGIDDIEMASFTSPKLTTMKQPIHSLAEYAVEALIDNIRNKEKTPSQIILEAEPIIRDSCGPCPDV
jgi:LacI family transcriptional regulator